MKRTSQTHPLQIAQVQSDPTFGLIGITFCPGKKQTAAATGAWDRDLKTDIAAIADWGAAAVVSLIEDHEIEALGVARLEEAVGDAHMLWLHLPIRDVSVPDGQFETMWTTAGAQLRAILRGGFNVLVHCKGGLGRAGMIAARLLVELGTDGGQAISMVRSVRPGAIETCAQLAYVRAAQPAQEPLPDPSLDACQDRALGAMLGLAVGDALGTTLEFSARDSRPRLRDMTGGGPFRLAAGQWTDDTAMALALLDSLRSNPRLDETDLMQRFVAWHERGSYSCTGSCFDIGITTRAALARFKRSGDPLAGSSDPMSAGNGSLMRLAPVAICHWEDSDRLGEVAARQSRTTHAAPQALDSCVMFAQMLAAAILGQSRGTVLRAQDIRVAEPVAAIMKGSWRAKHRAQIESSGYVAHSLEAAIWCVARTATFEDAVLLAANLGDDADTTAAITGQLAGALYGARAIPDVWNSKLAWHDQIVAKTIELFRVGRNAAQ